ncbi:hypothetical protein [Streptomyces sp. NPDC047097]|uniref:hypothetical protein n=1 Tax=Streptomyces sp. NPDC047097 TaxID=3155260 RepID=UPI0033FC8EB2
MDDQLNHGTRASSELHGEFKRIISTHPRHGAPPSDRAGEGGPEGDAVSVDRSRQPSAASLDPCGCPEPYCPLRRPPNEQRALLGADSPALTDLRARIAADLASRRRHGLLGRLL